MDGVRYFQNLQIFSNNQFGEIRMVTINDAPWFVGADVANALGYKNSRQALSTNVDTEDRGVHPMDTPSGKQEMTVINESGLYSLILSSKLPTAKAFKHWVTSEVLPTIRQLYINKAVSCERLRAPLLDKPAPVLPVPTSVVPVASPYIKSPPNFDEIQKAAELLIKCGDERLPYVLAMLRQYGFDLPEVRRRGVRPRKMADDAPETS